MSMAKVYTIAPTRPFVDELAKGILARVGDAPQKLAQVRVLLPTRRACRSLREAFLRLSDGAPMLLPVMTPLGDVDEDELALGSVGESAGLLEALDLPPAIGGAKRIALLARLVMAKDADTTPDQAVRLAGELAGLVDQVHTEGLDLTRLKELVVRNDLSEHWQKTVDFLDIIGAVWPQVLDEQGLLDPAQRRNALMRARTQAWRDTPPQTPVIAAGSTGTIPATAELLDVVARLPHGALVLPGLERGAPDEVWANFDPTHPQYGMAQLLDKIGVARTDVGNWTDTQDTHAARAAVITRAMVPAEATHLWRADGPPPPDALAGVVRLDAPTPREEASAIALILRRTLQTPHKTAALITPDRALARRVAVELGRWGLEVDDSAGTPLDQTPPGTFFHLLAEMAAGGFQPVHLLACLKHPLAAGGFEPAQMRAAVRALEIALLRGPRPGQGLSGLEDQHRVFVHDTRAAKRFTRHGLAQKDIRTVIAVLQEIVEPFAAALQNPKANAAQLLKLHVDTAVALSERGAEQNERRLWAGDAGEALSAFAAEAFDALDMLGPIAGAHYPALIQALMAGRAVRSRYAAHPRLSIWGLLEARLQNADVVVLGGLNEGVWPPEAEASPWMSRPMMRQFGLPLPERRIGLSAHDFVQAFAASQIYLTRSGRSGGSPQVPSRWLVRLETLLGEHIALNEPDGESWLHWADALTRPHISDASDAGPISPPRPTPPTSARPTRLSVTQVETWIRDPYAIYARRVLGLEPLDPLEADPGAADRGIVVHTALERFIQRHMNDWPENAEAELVEIGRQVFDEYIASPSVRAFWWPRFKRIAAWFVAFERRRRDAGIFPALIEQDGRMDVDGLNGTFTLTCKADRIDRDGAGGLVIVDYKTGLPPTTKQVESGLTPQLPLEAAIAKSGGFEGLISNAPIAGLLYLRLSGGRVAGETKPINLDAEQATQEAYEGLVKLVHKYDDEHTPYLSRPRPMFESRFGDFDHLARVKEWSGGDGNGGGEV
ncbi:double-strand break repair protein AddB [Magnetovibrio sp.]|uniref:double-strand break repair protein AddB n=1 Tax=Magnetovibrio sp. TaxID=2024836 RepID=UPI002F94078F